jgi:hypothetical protein
VKRKSELGDCRDLVLGESVDHLHIRRKAVVTGFTEDLKQEIADDCRVITVSISEWETEEVMTNLKWKLQKRLSRPDYWLNKLKTIGANIELFGFGVGASVELDENPDYSDVRHYLQDVAKKTDERVVLFLDYHGGRPVDGFKWVPKLRPLPENAVLVTDGFQRCELDESEEFEIGRLSESQTIEYLQQVEDDLSREDAREIHHTHDGNPVAIKIALEEGTLRKPLTGEHLDQLWERVYEDKFTAAQYDLLEGSAHLVDLDSRDVAMVVEKTRGECREILHNLEKEGIVSKKKAGLFTTDQYVKRYFTTRISDSELSENHHESFATYAERWVESYESQMQELSDQDEDTDGSQFFSETVDHGYTDPDLYLAIHHLSKAHEQLDINTFVEELLALNANKSGVFSLGVLAQRFFFENPKEVMTELSESILGIDEEVKSEIFSGTLDIMFGFNLQGYVSELSKGWTGEIDTEQLQSYNMSDPDEKVETIQQKYIPESFQGLPPEVKSGVVRLVILVYTDTRTAREYYRQFGGTAEKYGLDEEPFCEFLDELANLIEVLSPEGVEGEPESDRIESGLGSLNNEIRSRVELRDQLEQNRSDAQQEFQEQIERIRSKPNEIVDQFITCGDKLAETSNKVFPYLWYAFGDKMFSEIVLNQKSGEIHGEYKYWLAKREEKEKKADESELVIGHDKIESVLE